MVYIATSLVMFRTLVTSSVCDFNTALFITTQKPVNHCMEFQNANKYSKYNVKE